MNWTVRARCGCGWDGEYISAESKGVPTAAIDLARRDARVHRDSVHADADAEHAPRVEVTAETTADVAV
jgi:hypothetical protein